LKENEEESTNTHFDVTEEKKRKKERKVGKNLNSTYLKKM